ncbi:DUF262 domain-containing protein [Microbacterium oxydans]|uniref:DUF262 domain-containing protein n=1 Tax=Microbacterium oxydans TaxID=82380 RepID=UPI00226B7885|nr:DUF262 domain-containing protein [Microbacterium oxydans]WAA66424.1 DUF262 domain-containing protein [Microbacterium oxydans]
MDRVDYESMLVQDLLNAHQRGELNVSPWYQRRSVWSTPHKSYLINSIFLSAPVPTIYLRHTIDLEAERTVKEVVDGQQRCRSIIEYRNNEFSARHPVRNRRLFYRDLTATEREQFLMAKLPTAQLIGADDADVIDIFGRLNAVSKSLNPQEKRAAQYSGEFHQFCLNTSTSHLALWRDRSIFSAAEISRMQEVQFVADLAISMIEGITDFGAARITRAYHQWDEEFPLKEELSGRFDRVFNLLSTLRPTSLADTIFSRSPLFYSLFICLDRMSQLPSPAKLEDELFGIDAAFNDPRPATEKPQDVVDFVNASTSTTQRIRQRTVRDAFISRHLGS